MVYLVIKYFSIFLQRQINNVDESRERRITFNYYSFLIITESHKQTYNI